MRRYVTSFCFLFTGGVIFFLVPGFSFTGAIFLGVGVLLLFFALLHTLLPLVPKFVRVARKVLSVLLCIALLAAVPTGIWIALQTRGADTPECDCVIVLGAGVNGETPSRPLRERLEMALGYLEEYPDSVAVLTGGQGRNETVSEAQCMYLWLTQRGIEPSRLLLEERAENTRENIRFSLELLEAQTGTRPKCVAVISNEYHLGRAMIYCRQEGVEMLGCPAQTQHRLELVNMFLREIPCVWKALAEPLFA